MYFMFCGDRFLPSFNAFNKIAIMMMKYIMLAIFLVLSFEKTEDEKEEDKIFTLVSERFNIDYVEEIIANKT